MKSYDKMTESEKKRILTQEYEQNELSFGAIGEKYQTYANKIRRDAVKFKIPIRNKSEAQKTALKSGRHNHPTKGQVRPEEVKAKIGAAVLNSWESLSDTELESRKVKAKANWDKLSEDEKAEMLQKANSAVRKSSDLGSKLEIYLLKNLIAAGHKVEFHKEQTLVNTRLQIDLFLPSINTAIEVDGPSHYAPVWGEDVLQKNIKYDNKKNGLILGKGLYLVRIKQNKDFSNARAKIVLDRLLNIIEQIVSGQLNDKYIETGDV
jgi:very-short-patch-repair endonuclease